MSQPFAYEYKAARIPAAATQAYAWHYAKTFQLALTAPTPLSRSDTLALGSVSSLAEFY
jgi:hypothetical protein